MAKPTGRTRAFTRPLLAAPQGIPAGTGADALWRAGEEAEGAYDFEAARDLYLAAVHAASAAQALDHVHRYAGFLVQRFGQFAEVAAWLDDPAFEAPLDSEQGVALAVLLARAALEVGHPRLGALDRALAALGEPESLVRAAEALAASGGDAEARALLELHAARLPAVGPGRRLLERLRAEHAQRIMQAMAPVEAALCAHDVAAARLALETLRADWAQVGAFLSAQARVAAAEAQAQASELRRQIEAGLDAEDLAAATAASKALCALDIATDSDRNVLTSLQRMEREAALSMRIGAVLATTDPSQTFAEMGLLLDTFGAGPALPWSTPGEDARLGHLGALWATVTEAAASGPLAGRAGELAALHALRAALATQNGEALGDALTGLTATWARLPSPQRARSMLASQRELAALDAARQALQAIADDIGRGELDRAAQALSALPPPPATLVGRARQLKDDLHAARKGLARRQRVAAELDAARARQDFFSARRALAELAPHMDAAEHDAIAQSLDAEAAPALRARAMPPGLQKLQDAALLSGVGHGRLILAQDAVWMTVNLETSGLQPFALPAAWPLSAAGHARLGEVGDAIHAVGLSQGRLAVLTQRPGQATEVVAGAVLSDALRGDDLLAGSALQPESRFFSVLSRSSQRPGAATWTRLDAETLQVVEQRKTLPGLASLCGIEGLPDRTLITTTPRERQKGGWAAALADERGEPLQRFSNEDLGEAIAGFRQAVAWPAQDRIYASFTVLDPFEPNTVHGEPSLLVLRGGRVVFASSDLRRRFAPADRLAIDHAWTLDAVAGRLWFAAVSTDEATPGALLLGVDARTLRPDKPVPLVGTRRILALLPTLGGAIALCRQDAGGYALVRANLGDDGLTLTAHKLPL